MKNSQIINRIIRFISIIITLIFCINVYHHSSTTVVATTISSANIIEIPEHSNLKALIVPCTNTEIRDLYFPDTVLYLSANSGHYNEAGYDSSNTPARLTTMNVCENLTIGPNVTIKQVYLDQLRTPCVRHLKIINITTRVLYFDNLRYDCLSANLSSSTIPMNDLPSVEVRDSNILYHSDYRLSNDLMGSDVHAAAYFDLRQQTPPLSHLTLDGNNFECLAPLVHHVSSGLVACVLANEITLNGKFNFNNNKITSGVRAYQQMFTYFTDPFRAGLNFRDNEIVEDSRYCRDTLAKNRAENRCVAYFDINSVRLALVLIQYFQPLEYYPASDLLAEVPTTALLSQSPWLNMTSNSFTKIAEGNVSHRDRFCVNMFKMNVATHHLLGREQSETNNNNDVRYRPFLVNNNNFFIDYDNAEFVARPPGNGTTDPILLYYLGSEQYAAFSMEDNTLPLNLVQISRNKIDMKRAGRSTAIILESEASEGHLNCYRHHGVDSSSDGNSSGNSNINSNNNPVDHGLFEISYNNIVVDTRTKAALLNSRSSPSSFLSTSAFAVKFVDQMNNCDKISVRDNNATIHLYRPIEAIPALPVIATNDFALITIASQAAFCQFAGATNMGTIEFGSNNLVLEAQLNKQYINSVAMFVAPELNVFNTVKLFSLRNNRGSLGGQAHSIIFFVLELSKTVDFDSFEAIGNFMNATDTITQPCAKCGLLSLLPQTRSLGKKLATQNRGLALFNSRGLNFVNITRNEIWFTGGLTRGPETGLSTPQTGESDTAPTMIAAWGGAFEETMDTITSWTLIGNKMTVLQSDKVRPDVSSVVNLLQQSSNPNGGLIMGPFTRSISLHLDMRDNTLEIFTGTVNFLTFTSSLNPPSKIVVENNSVTRNLQGVKLDQEGTFESGPSVTQSMANAEVTGPNEGRREPALIWKMLPARSFFVSFMGRFVPPPQSSSSFSSSSSLSIRNNKFTLTNSFEQFLHFAVCLPTSHFAAISDKYHPSSCLDSSNTSVEHNQVNLHQIVPKKNGGENEISFLRMRVKQTQPPPFPLPTVLPDSDSDVLHEPGKILFDSNNITFRQTSWRNPVENNNNNNNPSLCTLASQSDLNPAAVHDQSQVHSSINYVDNNISIQEGCEVASLFDLQSYGHQKTEFTFERNNVLRRTSLSSSSTITALMSVNETAASENLESSSTTSRNRLLVNLSFHLNNIFSSSIVKSSNNNDDNEDSKIVDITSYSKKETVLPSLRRNFTKVDISAVNNVCNLMFTADGNNLMKDGDSSRTSNNESIRSTAFRKSPFISVPDLEDRECEPLPTYTPSKSLSHTGTYTSSLTRIVANIEDDDNNDDISTHDQTLATSTDVLQGIGIGAVGAAGAVVPSLGFGIARQQAMLNFVQNMRSGNCAGVKAIDGVPAADSPTQMSIGVSESRLYVGGVAGNFLLSFLLVVFGEVGGALILWKSKSSSWNKPFAVFARCNVALILFVCSSLLLAPTVTFGLVALTQSDVTLGEKVLAAIFSLLGFAVPAFGYAFWSLFVRTNRTQEQYRKVPREGKAKNASKLKKFITYWFEGEGEWMIPRKATLDENLQFDAATPLIEGYNGRAKWFGLAEFVVMFGLALAPFCANLSPVEKSCVTQFAVLLVVLTGFLLLCLFFRPFQELFNRIAVPVVTLCEIAVIAIAYVFAENPPPFIMTLAVLTSSLQSFMAVIVLIASLSPLTKHIMRAWKRFSRKVNNKSNKSGSRNSTKHSHHQQQGMSLRDLLNDGEDEELNIVSSSNKKKDSSRDDNNTTRSSQKHHDQKQDSGARTHRSDQTRTRDSDPKDNRHSSSRHRSDSTRDVNRSNNRSSSRSRSDNNNNDDKYGTRDSGSRQHQHQSLSSSSPRRREEQRRDERRPRHHEENASSSHHNERRERSSSRREPSSSSARRDYPVDRPYTPSSSNRKEKESSSNRLHTSSSSPSRRHGNDTTPSTSSHRHHRQQSPSDHHNTTNKRREKFAEI